MSDVNAATEAHEQPASQAVGAEPARRGNKWWTLVAVSLGTFMLLLDSDARVFKASS